jgi:peptide/nickel transport system substrate-binding protein
LFAKSATLSSAAAREPIWAQIDKQAMSDAAILPMVYAKSLFYRPTSLTNVYVSGGYGEYNDSVLGVKS